MRVTRLKASPRRFQPGSKRRGTRITFRLTAPSRVVFVVRGPAPSCEVVGRFAVRGHRGTNRVRFRGRVRGRTLEPGTYTVTARPAGRPRQSRPVVVIVGSGSPERLNCGSASGPEFLSTAPFGGGSSDGPLGTTEGNTGAVKTENQEEKSRGVLPAITKRIRELPRAIPRLPVPRPVIPGDGGSPPMVVGLAALALLALSALAIIAYVVRFVRGPYTRSA